jgi:hypothetical protein
MVKLVLTEVKLLESFLSVDTVEIFIPGDWIRRRVKINPYKAQCISMDMHGKQALILFLEPRDVIKLRGFGQFSIEAVRPSMIFARENPRVALVLRDEGKCTMAADIVKAVQVTHSVKAQHKGESSFLKPKKVAGLCEAQLVGNQDPFLRKDSSSLQLIHLWEVVPGSREGFRGLIWKLFVSWKGG